MEKTCQTCKYSCEFYEEIEGYTVLMRSCSIKNDKLVDDDEVCNDYEY